MPIADSGWLKAACDSSMHTACVWSEKLPFAGYSVVKEPFRAPNPPRGGREDVLGLVLPGRLFLGPGKPGGEYRARTGALLVANQALSQLS